MSKKTAESTEVVETKGTEVVNAEQDLNAWGDAPVSARDIIIPKILAMQGLSELVTDGKAKFGDFVDSVTHQVLGSIDKPLEFVPFHMTKLS